jgi:hypothetical protein
MPTSSWVTGSYTVLTSKNAMVISASERIEFSYNPARSLCSKKRVIAYKMKAERA